MLLVHTSEIVRGHIGNLFSRPVSHNPTNDLNTSLVLCKLLSSVTLALCGCVGAMQYFGIKDTDTPAYAIHDASSNSKYLLAKASPEDLTSFVAEFEVGFCC